MSFVPALAEFACLGMLGGWLHLTLLLKGVEALKARCRAGTAIIAAAARGAATISTFGYAASQGAIPLCVVLGGFLAARTVFIRYAMGPPQ